jgi:hypothetical protein
MAADRRTKPMPHLLQHWMSLVWIFFPLVCSAVASDTVTMGGAQIIIPPPSGLHNVIANPAAHWFARAYASASYEVAALYIPTGLQVENVTAGRDIHRHAVLVLPRHPALRGPKSSRAFREEHRLRQALAREGRLHVLRDAGNAFVTMDTRADPPASVVVATSSLLVRERLLTLHVASVRHSDDDRQWVIEATLRWIDSIQAANTPPRGRRVPP